MNRTQIYLPQTQIKKLKELAYKKRTTVSELVRDALDVQYATKVLVPQQKKRETLLEFAKRINSIGPEGPKDLATSMNEYLYGGKK